MPSVEFCRINRRVAEPTLILRPFAEDMRVLADQAQTLLRATVRDTEFIAADLTITSDGNFLTGLLGFAEDETLRKFQDEAHSWLKGETTDLHGATRQTVVPFATDLREKRRWTAYATTSRIRSTAFRRAFEATLNNAVLALGLMPVNWEVDPVMSVGALSEWLEEHPEVIKVVRVVKLTNPLRDVDEARRKMRALAAGSYRDVLSAPRAGVLDVRNPTFDEHVEPIETGDATVEVESRVGTGTARFRSVTHRHRTNIPPYGQDLQAGIERVLGVLAEFSDQRGDVEHGDE